MPAPPSCLPRSSTYPQYAMQPCDSSPSLYLPPTPTQSTSMAASARTSEDTLFGDKDFLDPISPSQKTLGRRKRTLFATATLVSLVFLAAYVTIQQRVTDGFANEFEPLPFNPEDVEPQSNTTFPVDLRYPGVRGPPAPLFRGERLSAAVNSGPGLTQFRQFIARCAILDIVALRRMECVPLLSSTLCLLFTFSFPQCFPANDVMAFVSSLARPPPHKSRLRSSQISREI